MGMLFLFLWRFFWMVHNALFIVILAILIAIVIHAPAKRLVRMGVPFRVALPLMTVVFVGSLVGLLVAMVPHVAAQIRLLATELPAALEQVQGWFRSQAGEGPGSDLSQNITRQATEFIGRFVPMAFNMITTVLGSFAIIVLATFFAAQPDVYRDLLMKVVPSESRDRWERVYEEAGRNLRQWTVGKALTMLFIGVVTYVGLTLFKIPGALALAAFAALMEFIPNFGPTIAAAPAVIAAFAIAPSTALYVAAFYFLLQQVQNAITVPLVERRAVNIPPAMLLVWQLMLAVGFGLMALFVATPLLAILVVAVRILYFEPNEERKEWNRRETPVPVPDAGAVAVTDSVPPHTPPGPQQA
ncbi:MAG TPA: AI-2E family transporter [Longimicrobium sp.]|nr:AI-2E family transporter [Longimicrobium sp.]